MITFQSLRKGEVLSDYLHWYGSKEDVEKFQSLRKGEVLSDAHAVMAAKDMFQAFQSLRKGEVLSDESLNKRSESAAIVSIPKKRGSPFGRTGRSPVPDVSFVSIPKKRGSPFGRQEVTKDGKVYEIVSIPKKRGSPFGLPRLYSWNSILGSGFNP